MSKIKFDSGKDYEHDYSSYVKELEKPKKQETKKKKKPNKSGK